MAGEDFRIIRDETSADGIRHVTAIPSALVCSRRIDFDVADGRLRNVIYEKGCNGNLKAVGRLLEGLTAEAAIEHLDGIDCNFRGTSCPDQLARILRAIK